MRSSSIMMKALKKQKVGSQNNSFFLSSSSLKKQVYIHRPAFFYVKLTQTYKALHRAHRTLHDINSMKPYYESIASETRSLSCFLLMHLIFCPELPPKVRDIFLCIIFSYKKALFETRLLFSQLKHYFSWTFASISSILV